MAAGVTRLYAIFNGFTHLRFRTSENAQKVNFENVPHFIFCAVTSEGEPIVIDTGFSPGYVPSLTSDGDHAPGAHVADGLKMLGFDCAEVRTVIMTHMHWDHTGGMSAFPRAAFVVQAREFNHMLNIGFKEETCYCPDHWIERLGRVHIINGPRTMVEGLRLICTGYHTQGHQAIVVESGDHRILLAGDEPSNYDQLWEAIPEDYWRETLHGPGKKFFWPREIKEALRGFVGRKEIDRTAPPVMERIGSYKQRGYRLVYSHDALLPKNKPVITLFDGG